MRMALPLFALCLIGIATTANANDYAQAKAQADRDEASLPRITAEAMHAAQQRAVDTVIERCAAPDADTAAFTVVAQLEASGKIMQTWREGDTPLSQCFERELRMLTLAAPPSSPFHIAFEISFTP